MKCQLCGKDSDILLRLSFYTRESIEVCRNCRELVEKNKHKPYSKVMEKLAMAESGYYANRKLARLRR